MSDSEEISNDQIISSYKSVLLNSEEIPEDFINVLEIPSVDQVIAGNSCCRKVSDYVDNFRDRDTTFYYEYHSKALSMFSTINPNLPIECLLNELRNSTYTILMCHLNFNFGHELSLNFVDVFLRQRHEILFTKMMKILGVDSASDVRFCDVFDWIESERTPDYISVLDGNVLIIEVTAVTNIERASSKKGDMSKGYDSKYKFEISQIEEKGMTVKYYVVIFDISDPSNIDYQHTIKEIAEQWGKPIDKSLMSTLDLVRKEFCNQSRIIQSMMGSYMSTLFNEPYKLYRRRMENVDHLLLPGIGLPRRNFQRITLSNFMYERLIFMWDRLLALLDNQIRDDNQKSELIYETTNNKFRFVPTDRGLSKHNWNEIILNDKKPDLIKHMKVMHSGVKVEQKPDIEFFFYGDYISSKRFNLGLEPFFSAHASSSKHGNMFEYKDFQDKVISVQLKESCSIYEDEDYLEKFISKLSEWEKPNSDCKVDTLLRNSSLFKKKPFSSHLLDDSMIDRSVDLYAEEMIEKNFSNERVIVNHAKQPFIYPMYYHQAGSYDSIHSKPAILNHLLGFGGYTDGIIKQCLKPDYNFGTKHIIMSPEYNDLKKEVGLLQREACKIQKLKTRETGSQKLVKLTDFEEGRELSDKIKGKLKDLKKVKKESGLREKEIPMIRMKTTGKSQWTSQFREEMSHFKNKRDKSVYKGVGLMENNLQEVYDELKVNLLSPSMETCPVELYDENVSDDVSLLKQLKEDCVENYSKHYKWLKNSNIYHTCVFVSRFCHTLLFYSQNSINSSYVMTDNLGYNNVLLLVKGGKKIFNTKRSKMFRLFFPIYGILKDWYQPPGYKSDFNFREINGTNYCITPWMNLNETLLTDGITLFSRLMGFSLLSFNKDLGSYENMDQIYFNLLLALHARRQTEAMMHNLRYITVNCMSVITCLDKMLPELAGFNYDCFQAYIRYKVKVNFSKFGKSLKSFHDQQKGKSARALFKSMKIESLMNDHVMYDLENLACTIYSTYLMSKAPTTQSLEQVSNLKGMLETHKLFGEVSSHNITEVESKNCITIDNTDYRSYHDRLFDNDFNFDPKMCSLIGSFCADYLLNYTTQSDLHVKWDQILNEPWDIISNSKGLRYEGSEFFGNKGYFVVYKDILTDNPSLIDDLFNSISDDLAGKKTRKRLDKLNQSFRSRYAKKDLEKVVFHVVDKQQRGGKREIFVMDWNTKTHQHSLESFAGHLCRLIPNEMISIPSNKRLSTIHTKVFENVKSIDGESYYWVLDCRKWAPRSMIQKFVHFLMGMRRAMPESFIEHALNFFSLLLKKRVYTRPHIVEIMKKSAANKNLNLDCLVEDEETKGVYFEMTYSWMMGIFNYFSSLMHVANQLLASHIINHLTTKVYGDHITLNMVAHSDDSAGKIIVPNKFHLIRSALHYETILKASNHMLSDKKSNMGGTYYEFLSVLYVGGELLSLLGKFLGLFNYHPSDQGMCVDMTDAYSKCMEMIINGANLSQSYMALKIQSMLIWRFYMQNTETETAKNLPPQMGGIPDSHPLMILMCGSDSDLIRLYLTKGEDHLNKLSMINRELNRDDYSDDTFLSSFKSRPDIRIRDKISNLKTFIKTSNDLKNNWGMLNVNFKNTALNTWQFITKLDDPMFLSSLQDESLTRRLSRAFHFRSHSNVMTKFGKVSYKQLREIISMALMSQIDNDWFELLSIPDSDNIRSVLKNSIESNKFIQLEILCFMHSEPIRVLKFLNQIRYHETDKVNFPKTCKPVHFLINKSGQLPVQNYDPASLVAWIKYPEIRSLLPDTRNFQSLTLQIEEMLKNTEVRLDSMDDQKLFLILNKLKSKTVTNVYCYSNMPSGYREIETYQDLLLFISHNSFPGKLIQGLAIPFGKSLTMPMSHILTDLAAVDVQWTLAFTEILISTYENQFYDSQMLDLLVNSPEWLQCDKLLPLSSLIGKILQYWDHLPNISQFFSFHMHRLGLILNDMRFLDPSILKKSFFSSFVKRQFLVENTWLGVGQLFINIGGISLNFSIRNRNIISVTHNVSKTFFTPAQHKYIDYCLKDSQLGSITDHMREPDHEQWAEMVFGVSYDGILCIQKGIDQNIVLTTNCDQTLNCMLSNLSSGSITTTIRNRLYWTGGNEIDGYKRFKLKLLPINTQNCVSVAKDLIVENRENEQVINRLGKGIQDFMVEIGLSNLDVQYKVARESVFNFFNATQLYKIFSIIETKDVFQISKVKYRDNIFPGQTGGLLSVLIDYSKLEPKFNFTWDRVVSPELMMIKSSQPEAFVSDLVINVAEKYNRLFDETDKLLIVKELSKIMDTMSKPNIERDLLSLMANWSNVGFMGALESLKGGRSQDNFKMFRGVDYQKEYTEFYIGSLKFLIRSLYDTVVENPSEFNDSMIFNKNKHIFQYKLTDFRYNFVAAIHLMVTKTYTKNSNNVNTSLSTYLIFFSELIENILINEQLRDALQIKLSKTHLLSMLPLKPDLHGEWVIVLNTLFEYFISGNMTPLTLKIVPKLDDAEGGILPFVKTKDLLDTMGITIDVKNIRHHGLATREMISFFNGTYFAKHKRGFANVKFEVLDSNLEGNDYIPLNRNFFFKYRLSESFITSENFEEVIMELENAEPDIDYIDGLGIIEEEMYDIPINYQVMRVINGKMCKVDLIKFTVLFMIVNGHYTQFFEKIRQAADNILIICDCLPLQIITLIPCVKVFKLRSRNWLGKSLVPSNFYFALVVSNNWDDNEMWCNLLDAYYMNSEDLQQLLYENPSNLFYDGQGEVGNSLDWLLTNVDKRNSKLTESMEMIEKKEEELIGKVDEFNDYSTIEAKLEELKIKAIASPSLVEKFKEIWFKELSESRPKQGRNVLQDICMNLLNHKEKVESLLKLRESVLSGELTTQEYENIFQIPLVWGPYRSKKSNIRNRALKEPKLISEIDALMPGFGGKIISGLSSISPKLQKRVENRLKICRKVINHTNVKKRNKSFLVDFYTLVLNDSKKLTDSPFDEDWNNVLDYLDERILDEEEEVTESVSYQTGEGEASLGYKPIMEEN